MKTPTKIVTILAALASSAFGDQIVLTPGNFTGGNGGGEFTAKSATLSNSSYAANARSGSTVGFGGSFETFCMAYTQEFSYGNTLGYTLTDHTADFSSGTIQALTSGTAWLYSQFAQGNILLNSSAANTDFQLAIWWLQQSNGAPGIASYNSGNTYESMVVGALGSGNVMTAAGANNDGVSIILTEYDDAAGSRIRYSQPQLYYHVPEQGTTLALLGLAFLGLVAFRRQSMGAK